MPSSNSIEHILIHQGSLFYRPQIYLNILWKDTEIMYNKLRTAERNKVEIRTIVVAAKILEGSKIK